jgi:DNA repair protein RadD
VNEVREYQVRAVDALRQKIREGKRRIVLCSPTASGKSAMVAEVIKGAVAKGNPVLFWVHRRELVKQMHARMRREGIDAGLIMAGKPTSSSLLQIASIQSLVRREPPPARIVVIDEAHRVRGATHEMTLAKFPDAVVIGLTASPIRLDQKGLGDVFDDMVVAATTKDLITQGYLADYSGFAYLTPDLSSVRSVAGDYDEAQLGEIYGNAQVIGDVVGRYLEHCRGQRAILFASTIENSKAFVAAFVAAGISAEHLDHRVPTNEREAIIDRVTSGATTVISNVGILGEGVHDLGLQVVILARPSRSLSFYLQAVGRGFAPKPDGSRLRIHDHASLVAMHGLPDEDRHWALTMSKQPKPAPLHTCKRCFAIYDKGSSCPLCGFVAPVEERDGPEHVAGVEVDIRKVSKHEMAAFKEQLIATAIARHYRPGYVVARWKEKYPDAPLPWGAFRRVRDAQR